MTSSMPRFLLNETEFDLELAPDAVFLDVLRLRLGLEGTKEGCREGDCGACAVLLGELLADSVRYRPVCACLLPAGDVGGRHVVTIEGLRVEGLSPVQQALVDGGGIQCGFCTPGLVVALTGHLLSAPVVTEDGALADLAGNVCRCTGYAGIRRAVGLLASRLPELGPPGRERVDRLIAAGVLPEHFGVAPSRLAALGDVSASAQRTANESAFAQRTALRRDDQIVVGGATDLLVASVEKLRGEPLRFVGREERLRGIARDGEAISVGAAVTAAELQESPEIAACYPALRDALSLFASPLIRSRATVAGNLVNASPIADIAIALLALGAKVVLEKGDELRTIALEDLYLGYKKLSLREGELVARIDIPIPVPGARFHFEKVSRRRLLDIASVNSALSIVEERGVVTSARLSAGGVAPVPLLLREISRWLAGRPLTAATVLEAAKMAGAEVAPISDVRGSAAYKALLLERLVRAHFAALFPDRIDAMGEVAP
jgi:xanthine dehydrogenase small subunit